MKSKCSCGFIINVVGKGWLLGHPTGNSNWDFPKGRSDEDEPHINAAVRELLEETGIDLGGVESFEHMWDNHYRLNGVYDVIDIGQHEYNSEKDLHMFYIEIPKLNVAGLECTSMVCRPGRDSFPEMDRFQVFALKDAIERLSKSMFKYVANYVVDCRTGVYKFA